MVEALYPVGKTQWAKWNDEQRTMFNESREAGVSFSEAVAAANAARKKGPNLLGILGDVVGVAAAVSGTAAAVDVAVSTVKRATRKKDK